MGSLERGRVMWYKVETGRSTLASLEAVASEDAPARRQAKMPYWEFSPLVSASVVSHPSLAQLEWLEVAPH